MYSQSPTPTITRPDLDRDQDVTPKALRPYKVIVLDWTTVCSIGPSDADHRSSCVGIATTDAKTIRLGLARPLSLAGEQQ